jgi:type I restriction enzyme S subunit
MINVTYEKRDAYKDSGVEWLGEVPKLWAVVRNKEIFQERSVRSITGKETLLTVSHITGVTPRSAKNVNMFMAETMVGYKLCQIGDLLINTMWAWMGALGTSNYQGICSPSYHVYMPRKYVPYDHRYFDYLYRTPNSIIEMTRNSKGIVSSRLRLYAKDFFQIKTVLPTLAEQKGIADYLYEKTAVIDKKISLLTQKAARYKELKQALINETVTRGLDKTVPMKDSGIDWIGKIPAHWDVKRFKEIFNKTHTGWTPDTKKIDNFIGSNTWVTIGDMIKASVCSSKSHLSDQAIKNSNILITRKGSLLLSFKLSIGKIAFADCDLYTNEAIISIEDGKNTCLDYFFYTLPIFVVKNAKENIYGAKLLNQQLISNSLLLTPPLPEQKAIADYLDVKTAHIDCIVETIHRQIKQLQELRKTLINDVVTGKIKVVLA